MTAPKGEVYYTLDGSDPRVYGTGEIFPAASLYTGPVTLTESRTVKARTLDGETWSALNELFFERSSPARYLRITEIMYHPPPEGEEDGDEFEFIEIKNTGPDPVDLTGMAFTEGIFFRFAEGTVLRAGGFAVLVSNEPAFKRRYPGTPVAGVYDGRLANDGDTIAWRNSEGIVLESVTYRTAGWWPYRADGLGRSLVAAPGSARADPNDPAYWTESARPLGSPGEEDANSVPLAPSILHHPDSITVREGEKAVFSVLAYAFPDPTFRWQRNGVDIPGAVHAFYTVTSAALSDDGARFRCIVANEHGEATTSEAVLTVSSDAPRFRRGDANSDGKLNVSDAIWILKHLLGDGRISDCPDALDANDDGAIDISDPAALLRFIFTEGAPLPAPLSECGFDPTSDDLDCRSYSPCEDRQER